MKALETENFQVSFFESLQSSNLKKLLFGYCSRNIFLATLTAFRNKKAFQENFKEFFETTFAFVFERGFGSTVKQQCFSFAPSSLCQSFEFTLHLKFVT